MKKHNHLNVLSLIFFVIIYGCAHQSTLNANIKPTAFTAKKSPLTAAIVISKDIKNCSLHTRPKDFEGSAHSYEFNIGNSLSKALVKSVETSYSNVVESGDDVRPGKYDKIIKFSDPNSNMDISFRGGILTRTARATFTISVLLEIYDGVNLQLLRKTMINGDGSIHEKATAISADNIFAKAIEIGLQNVSDNAANILINKQ